MPRKTKTYHKMPWTGGLNTSVDSGILNDNDLVKADNVVFAESGSRVKRKGFTYMDTAVPAVTYRESSSNTRTVYTSSTVIPVSGSNELVTNGEFVVVSTTAAEGSTEDTKYVDVIAASTIASSSQVDTVTTVADVSDSLDGTTFILADENGTVAFWYDVDDSGTTIPAAASAADRAVEITTVSTDDTANTVASLTSTAVNADSKFSTSVATNVVTVTAASTGYRSGQSASTSGFTLAITMLGTTNGKISWTDNRTTNTEAFTATSTLTLHRGGKIKSVIDYWRRHSVTNEKEQEFISWTDQGKMFRHTKDLNHFEITKDSTATTLPTTQFDNASWEVFNETLIVASDGLDNQIVKYNPDNDENWLDLGGTPPKASIVREHLSRVWCNDKTRPDRLHYSETGNAEVWNGTGDSGVLDIGIGDGDSAGITAIFPTFKDRLIVAKGRRLYQIIGTEPETFQVKAITSGLGVEAPSSIAAVDQDDMLFISRKGIHSVASTAAHGDFEGAFLSKKIQRTFDQFPASQLKLSQATYIANLNSVAFGVPELGNTNPDDIYFYNIEFKEWYRWPNQSCTSMDTMILAGKETLVLGTEFSRLVRTNEPTFNDFGSTAINYEIESGTIYPGGNLNTLKLFKSIRFIFRPIGNVSFTASIKVDNQAAQSLTFSPASAGEVLGTDFYLGTTVLGGSNVLAPETRSIDGIGRGLTINITNSTADDFVDIQGFIIEFQELEQAAEVIAPE